MELCKHLAWVNLDGEHAISIHDEGRLLQILGDLADPQEQRPPLIFFVGRKAKNVALREFFPYNNIKKGRQDGLANIRVDTTTLNSEYPILFADSDVTLKTPVKIRDTACHEKHTYRLQWQPPPELTYSDIIHARLFFLFTDVICIFADDFVSLDDVVNRLKSWTVAGSISSSSRTVRPKVVIVIRGDEASVTFNILQAQDLRFNLYQQDLIVYFSSIVVLYLADQQISPLARHRRLKEVILRHVDEVRQLRQNAQFLYSATHLARFFREATQHLSCSGTSPFNFINVSRKDNVVQQDYCTHILRISLISRLALALARGLIVLSLFVRRWDISYCSRVFDTLTRQFFRRRIRGSGNLIQQIRHVLRCWWSDGYYDVRGLENSLTEYFGTEQRMFDHTGNTSDIKIAVTATTISDASPYLFSSYNGSSVRSKDCGYKHLRPENTADEPYVWEALFRLAHIAAIGTFQDGGLKHNNPINLALWESSYIWPSITRPDVVLSLGTGTETESISPRAPNFRHVFQDGFIPRLYRSFISSLDGQSTWRDLQNRLDRRSRQDYFRLNVSLTKEQWTIDDIDQMSELRRQVHLTSGKEQDLHEIAFAPMVSSFFFELIKPPTYTKGSYYCEGTIRSRLNSVPVEQVLKRIQASTWTFVTDTENLGCYESEYDSCAVCHRYQKRIGFSVRLLTDHITIYVQSTATTRRKISGFPQTISWFITQQYLNADFGAPNHGNPTHRPCEACKLELRPNLKRKSSGESSEKPKARKKSPDFLTES